MNWNIKRPLIPGAFEAFSSLKKTTRIAIGILACALAVSELVAPVQSAQLCPGGSVIWDSSSGAQVGCRFPSAAAMTAASSECKGGTVLKNPPIPGTCFVCVISPYDTQIPKGNWAGLITGQRATGVPATFPDCVAAVGTPTPSGQSSYTCISQVSTGSYTGLSPAVIKAPTGTMSLGPSALVSGATPTIAASKCHARTRALFHTGTNRAWSIPAQFCTRVPAASKGLVSLVYATDYFKELGNSAGVNRVDGFAVICDPTSPFVIPSTI